MILCKLPVYILDILPRVVIWNGTAKWVTLDPSNSQILGIEVYGIGKELARTSEGE